MPKANEERSSYAHSDINTHRIFGTVFAIISEKEQQDWIDGYAAYVKRITAPKARGFSIWITDFGFRT